MKAKHLNIEKDKALYLEIRKEIKDKLIMKKKDADYYFIFKSLIYGVLTIGTYYLLYILENPVLFIIDFVAFGFIAVLLCFNFAHDFSHHAIFKKPFWDNIGFEFIYTLVGAHPEAWKGRHLNSHHYAPNVEHFDTDLAITGLIRVLPTSKLKWYHKFQHMYAPFAYATYSFYWVFIKDFIVLSQSIHLNNKEKLRYYFTFFILKSFYVTYLFVLPFYFGHQSFGTILIAGIAMHIVQSIYTLFTFFITHHVEGSNYPKADINGLINTSWVMNQIKSSNNFYPFSQLGNFIFGGVNNHIAHHLFPNISHYHYPKLNVVLFETLEKNGIKPSVTSYFGGVVSHLKLLKSMGQANSGVLT
jgi:linoleoyl-CoA desaturase